MKIDYKKFITENFNVIDKDTLVPIPFRFNSVQEKYYNMLTDKHKDLQGTREIILKARQQGMSSFVLALFAADFLLRPYSVSICISHRKDATDILFKKVKGYLTSYFQKIAEKQNMAVEDVSKQFLKSDSKNLLENATNGATFYIGTAGAKVGGRGGTANNLHLSEVAYYQDSEIITANEIVLGTSQQVPQGIGMIFMESTGNMADGFFYEEWERSNDFDKDGKSMSIYNPRFFSWEEFYSPEWIAEKKREFTDEKKFRVEYPQNPEEAFMFSGTPFFDNMMLKTMLDESPMPTFMGKFEPDGQIYEN